MELIKLSVEDKKFKITGKIINQGDDLIIIIGGGKNHIGAVGVTLPPTAKYENITSTSIITLPGHKDDVICKLIGEKISKKTGKIVTIISGIHYDNLTKEEIEEIVNLSKILSEKILKEIHNEKN